MNTSNDIRATHSTAHTEPHKKEGIMDKIHEKAHELKEKIMPHKEAGAATTTTNATPGHVGSHHTGNVMSHDAVHGTTSHTYQPSGTTTHGVHGTSHNTHGAPGISHSLHQTGDHVLHAPGRRRSSSSSSSSSDDEENYYNSPTRGRVRKPGLGEKIKNKVHQAKEKVLPGGHQTHAHEQTHPSKLHGDKYNEGNTALHTHGISGAAPYP